MHTTEMTPDEMKAELERLYTLIGGELASERQGNIEHLIACARIGKETTVIGKGRHKQLLDMEKARDALLAACKAAEDAMCCASFVVKNRPEGRDLNHAIDKCRAARALAQPTAPGQASGGETPPDDTCPTCGGSGEVFDSHESYAVERLGCPRCMGSGRKSQ